MLNLSSTIALIFVSGLLSCASFVNAADANKISLKYDKNTLVIIPETLATTWNELLVNQAGLTVAGKKQTAVNIQTIENNHASWTLMPANIHVKAKLTDELTLSFIVDKSVTIKRNKPLTLAWLDLPENQVSTLYLPIGQGVRVPTDNDMWANLLTSVHTNSNTTHNFKMPFWTAKQADRFVSYQLVTATNNRIYFTEQANKIDMQARHHFTPLNKSQSFDLRITMGDNLLAGAKKYRQWRKKNGQSTPLADKVKYNQQHAKLIGATHVYLFGSDGIAREDVKDWHGLKAWYFDQSALPFASEFKSEAKILQQSTGRLNNYQKQLLVNSINASLSLIFSAPRPTLDNNAIGLQFEATQQRKQWLSERAGTYLFPEHTWGQALSTGMVKNLKKAGLKKLWLGFDSWWPAFYQPKTIEQAKSAGYLIGTYDSYNTAIAAGVNDSWDTAQLPDEMRKKCAIELANGKKQQGFKKMGNYLNPKCHRPYVEKRIQDIIHYGRFNSLFLDVDATAMAREDYSDNTSESQMLAEFNARMKWIAEEQNIVLGSEDGNSLTTQGISFGHGLETPVFGWTDKDMRKNRKSPYYFGRWYPSHRPEVFFKPVLVKEPYKTLLFSPEFRIPLYQAVFHDEVISSHHWGTDNLKLTDVQAVRDLIGMLYNAPPMIHLTRTDANSLDTPRIKALTHYQQGFIATHKVLWDKQLTEFRWLDEKGQIQQTHFSDGSIISANFSEVAYQDEQLKLAPLSIHAQLSNGENINWQSKVF